MERTTQPDPALHGAASAERMGAGEDLTLPVGALVTRPPVLLRPEATVGEAARAMREAGQSSALVAAEPPGILTDRDLRSRVLAEGRGPETPVREVMSSPLISSAADTPLFEALRRMLERQIHHLPIIRGGEIVAILGNDELLRHRARSPLGLMKRIEQLREGEDVPPDYSREVTGIVETLFAGGLGVTQISAVIASLGDALAQRLLCLAEDDLGSPPCPYAWIVCGAEGRREQVLLSDQDNALVYRDEAGGVGDYFRALADRVVDGLIRAGFPPCPGGYMATNWCLPLAEWEARFRGWVAEPQPRALLEAQVFFDFRAVHGGLSLRSLDEILLSGGRRELFLYQLARAALGFRPPLGFRGRVRTCGGAIDLKAGGIAATVMLARVYALAAGAAPRPTLERLAAAAEAGTLSRGGAEVLGESFRFLSRLRLQEQLRALRAGDQPDNRVRLDALSELERRRLGEALQAVRKMQDATALRFKTQSIA